jgi:hypothetical protein
MSLPDPALPHPTQYFSLHDNQKKCKFAYVSSVLEKLIFSERQTRMKTSVSSSYVRIPGMRTGTERIRERSWGLVHGGHGRIG